MATDSGTESGNGSKEPEKSKIEPFRMPSAEEIRPKKFGQLCYSQCCQRSHGWPTSRRFEAFSVLVEKFLDRHS